MGATLTSIAGLQNLTNLQQFKADFNSLTSIDLSGMSSLTLVDISDNDVPGAGTNSLASINLSGCTSLEELYLDDNDFSGGFPNLSGLDSLRKIDFDQCGITGSVDLSDLPALEGIDLSSNEGITEIIISSTQPIGDNNQEFLVNNCALTQTAVDNILVALADSAISDGYIDISNNGVGGGTNAAPGAAGLAALTVLAGKGWSYDVAT
jgi:hypothetical protein